MHQEHDRDQSSLGQARSSAQRFTLAAILRMRIEQYTDMQCYQTILEPVYGLVERWPSVYRVISSVRGTAWEVTDIMLFQLE